MPACRALVQLYGAALPTGGRLLIHDSFLNDDLDGPLPVALFGVALFCQTEGRAYSVAECQEWLAEAGLEAGQIVPTLLHSAVLAAYKRPE